MVKARSKLTEIVIRYQDTNDRAILDELCRTAAPRISKYAAIMHHRDSHFGPDEYLSAGLQGMVDAAGRFDRYRKAQFETFMNQRVMGQMLDYARQMGGMERRTLARNGQIRKCEDKFVQANHRYPTTSEICERINKLNRKQLNNTIRNLRIVRAFSLDMAAKLEDSEADKAIGGMISVLSRDPLDVTISKEALARILDVTASFPIKVGHAFRAYYFEGRTMKDIGKEIGLTESRVSQILGGSSAYAVAFRKEALSLAS